MIHLKTPEEVKIMQHGGHILAEVLHEVCSFAKAGVTELELDQMAEKLIREKGGEPGFQKVPGYHHTICASTNSVVIAWYFLKSRLATFFPNKFFGHLIKFEFSYSSFCKTANFV